MDKETIEKLDLFLEKTAAFDSTQREEGLKLLDAYKKDPCKETFTPLYKNYKPLIMSAAKPNTFRSPLPASAHWALATQSFMDSIRTFKPGLAPFHIHAIGTIFNRGKRLNLKYQNIGYIPEARATKYQVFNNATTLLKENLGRKPSTLEIADELAWSPKMVETFTKELRKDRVLGEGESEMHSLVKSDKARQALQDFQYSLIPAHQLVMEHALGLNGNVALTKPGGGPDLQAIAKTTKLSIPKIRSALKTITRKYKQHEGHLTYSDDESEGEA